MDFLDSIGQPYVTDSTNLEADVLRNKIRLRVLPLLEEIAPGATANIDKTANYLCEAEKVFQTEMLDELSDSSIEHNGDSHRLPVSYLLQQPSPSAFLHEWLVPFGFNSTQTEQILDCLAETGREFVSQVYTLAIDRGYILVEPIAKPMKSIKIPECGTYRYDQLTAYKLEVIDSIEISKSDDVATLDADKVKFPLTLRPVDIGDRFVPFGMKGSKLVSDYLTDQKVSILDKRRQLVMVDSSGAIIWLVGRRTDNRYRISNDTKRIIRITIK